VRSSTADHYSWSVVLRARRSLVAAAAVSAALTLTPSTAFAAPERAPVVTYNFGSLYAYAYLTTTTGDVIDVNLYEHRASGGVPRAGINITIQKADGGWAFGGAELDSSQVDFDRNLGQASARDVPVQIVEYVGWEPQVTTTVLDLTFTGVGGRTNEATHDTSCLESGGGCQEIRVSAQRAAAVSFDTAEMNVKGDGFLTSGRAIDASVPRPAYDY
jgi:hypothetical protein